MARDGMALNGMVCEGSPCDGAARVRRVSNPHRRHHSAPVRTFTRADSGGGLIKVVA